jgi:hypothetical protein
MKKKFGSVSTFAVCAMGGAVQVSFAIDFR